MRASKENAEKAIHALCHIEDRTDRLPEEPSRVNAQQWKNLNRDLGFLHDFLKRAKAKLPSEAAFDVIAKRKSRRHAAAMSRAN